MAGMPVASFVRRCVIAAVLGGGANAVAQPVPPLPQIPGFPGGQLPGIPNLPNMGGAIDCKMLQEMLRQPGMPPQLAAMLGVMGCSPDAAAPKTNPVLPASPAPRVQAPEAKEAKTLGDHACAMFQPGAYSGPLMWLGPMTVLGARELPESCPLTPPQRSLIEGLVRFGEGRFEQSITAFQAAASQARDEPAHLRALTELSKSQLAAGLSNEARETAERALKISLTQNAATMAEPGVFTSVEERMRHAMAQGAAADAARNRSAMRAELLIVLGLVLQHGNDLGGAIARFQEADNVMRTRGAREGITAANFDDPEAAITRPFLAAALLKAGRSSEAQPLLQAMVRGREQTIDLAEQAKGLGRLQGMPGGNVFQGAGASMEAFALYGGDMYLPPFACAALAGIDGVQSAERSLETTEQCRARVLASVLANRLFHAPERADLPSAPEIESYARERKVDRDRAIRELLEQRTTNPRARAASRPATVDDMRQMAAERNATLVVYAINYTANTLPVRMPDRETGITAWVITPEGRVTARRRDFAGLLPEGTLALTAAAFRLRETMGVPGRGIAVATKAALRPATSPGSAELRRFHQLLIEPISDLLPTRAGSRLIIVPERALFMVPFAALENASGEPLIAQHAITVTPSMQSLALAALRKRPAAVNATSVIVGNPLMPTYAPRPGGPRMEIPPLPGAEEEARAIAHLLKSGALTGAAATKQAVLTQAVNARYIHLATHGFLDRLTTVAQSGVNPHVREIALFDQTAGGGVRTPGMLALAPSGGPDNDSGMLTADEIAAITTTAELVVMSACDSGRGAINDDGVIGLSRAWMAAGAPSVMVTLWTIPDDATTDLMVAFYQQLVAGTRKAEALRLAILAARAKYPDPFNWAAFMLIGEPD